MGHPVATRRSFQPFFLSTKSGYTLTPSLQYTFRRSVTRWLVLRRFLIAIGVKVFKLKKIFRTRYPKMVNSWIFPYSFSVKKSCYFLVNFLSIFYYFVFFKAHLKINLKIIRKVLFFFEKYKQRHLWNLYITILS